MLHNRPLEWTSKLKYLGIVIISVSPFAVCLDSVRKKYFAAINALNAHCKYVAEPVKLHLYESYCLPILLYGIDCINLSSQQSQEFEVCWNNAYRKIFGYKLHESVKILICLMQRLDFRKLYDLRRLMFITKLSLSMILFVHCYLYFSHLKIIMLYSIRMILLFIQIMVL